jgi:hypothetical protein
LNGRGTIQGRIVLIAQFLRLFRKEPLGFLGEEAGGCVAVGGGGGTKCRESLDASVSENIFSSFLQKAS